MLHILKEKILTGCMKLDNKMPNNDIVTKGLPRSCECILAIIGLVLLFPLFIICALLVFFSSPGGIFFRQKRVGFNGETFTLYKFRTMFNDKKGILVTADGDSRITRIGRVLRKTKLDELPEIYNVLRGDMSFVGPRPEVPDYVDLRDSLWQEVLSVRPGITDPATLQLRNEEAFLAEVVDKEAYYRNVIQPYKLNESIKYQRTRSLKNDLGIIFQTFKIIIFPQTAPKPTIEKPRLSFIK